MIGLRPSPRTPVRTADCCSPPACSSSPAVRARAPNADWLVSFRFAALLAGATVGVAGAPAALLLRRGRTLRWTIRFGTRIIRVPK